MQHSNEEPRRLTDWDTLEPLKAVLIQLGVPPEELTPEAVKARRQRLGEAAARARAERCPTCQGYGWLSYDVERGHPLFGQLLECHCSLVQRRNQFLARLPVRTLDDFRAGGNRSFKAALDGAREYAVHRGKPWLVLAGDVGTGKTHLAIGILRARAEANPPEFGHFLPVAELLSWVRQGIGVPPGSLEPDTDLRVQMASEWPFLALDDMGAHYDTPWAEARLQEILDARYRYERETIVTLNVGMEQFPDRLSSRLRDNRVGWHFILKGPDYRQLPGR